MPKSSTIYKVFLASPSDVKEERILIKSAIDELNLIIDKTQDIRLDLIKWETDSYPSIGEDAQDVINNQINDYDFFIGLMWGKIGMPTKRAKSGTIEEFTIAYNKYKKTQDIKILFYFSDKPISPSDINPEQISELNKFKEELKEKGVLYHYYSKPEEFQTMVKMHLTQHLLEIKNKDKLVSKLKENSKIIQNPELSEDKKDECEVSKPEDLGLLEYLDLYKESFSETESTLEKLGNYIAELGKSISKRGDKIDGLKLIPFDTNKDIRKEIDRAANDMMDYVRRTDVEIPIFHDNFYKGMEALSNALTIQDEDGMISLDELKDLLNAVINNINIFTDTISKINGFKLSVNGLPRITSNLKKAKNRVDETLEQLLSELKSSQNLTIEFEIRLKKLIEIYK